uniref:Cycloeucalenol cycloisomerase n=1 Tax=Oryza rufipogon TaxID=4529 RepID=A0A0E0R796_ORYRU
MAAPRRPAAAKARNGGGAGRTSRWMAADGSKRWGETFFLLYTPFWLTLCLGVVVPFKLYEANIWIIIFSYVGNYFWTHYFFTVLGASYTFPSWRMNNVPHTTFLLTHACFLFYHMTSNMTLRKLRHSTAHLPQFLRWSFEAAWVLALSYFIAYLETLAIANFPYYEFIDRDIMYKVGSLFYAIYFIVSFPMFSRIDENEEKWSLSRVAVDALGAAMLVTIILDLWRIFLGPIVPIPESRRCGQPGLAWFQVQNERV